MRKPDLVRLRAEMRAQSMFDRRGHAFAEAAVRTRCPAALMPGLAASVLPDPALRDSCARGLPVGKAEAAVFDPRGSGR